MVRCAAGVNRRWYSLATSNAVWQPRLQHFPLHGVFQPPIKYHSAIAQLCGFNLLVNPGLASWGISSVGPISKGVCMSGFTGFTTASACLSADIELTACHMGPPAELLLQLEKIG